ncbi:hypothetical protein EBBID32_31420 [Sphingobium indicum BiD32]|uniref:Uncharacterized protein n=1 Tax=Sphingobium indicum BiD32 TaxID=1301087 RepID=N1MSZ1_9SPHN|nr:hypothetical protein [Sphingobium indicum]CCW18787.1 hypothetical protein EBBID32_31420 [Sphingobium indicum BiD32]
MPELDPLWVAPKEGHDWRDDTVLLATAWLESLASKRDWGRRLDQVRSDFLNAKSHWLRGEIVPLYDASDLIAWYIFQAKAYAQDRMNWVPEEAVRIVPTLTRIGQELERLLAIPGAETRAARLMNAERRQPDSGLFELLVALAYRRKGWESVSFVPETPGAGRTPDLLVSSGRRRWAVECKRMGRSTYHISEKRRGDALARRVHEISLDAGRSIEMHVAFRAELNVVPDNYLADRAEAFLKDGTPIWDDAMGKGMIFDIDWRLARRVLAEDDVYYGSSRMIELLVGHYDHGADHSMTAKWRPSRKRPFWAETVYQASVVSWRSQSRVAVRRKARHFRSIIADANGQLPADRPGVIHVGSESWAGDIEDGVRHMQNITATREFDPGESRLRWVYGNYFAPEVTTREDESWAIEETMAPYRIGRHSTGEPLPGHLLISPDDKNRAGVHWDKGER